MGQAPYGYRDRETSLHDGRECYVKLGRLAVVRDARGRHYGRMLVDAALAWMCKHPGYFNPSVANWGLEALGYTIPEWRGLVCVHAQVQVVPMWESMGFKVDEKMGKWYEEGIPHVGMWKRCVIPEVERRGS
jgi:predicted GNAT family N-acyltransferase